MTKPNNLVNWRIHYKDGSVVNEINGNYRSIDRHNLVAWDILYLGKLMFRLDLRNPDLRIFRRVRHRVSVNGSKSMIFMFGYLNTKLNSWNIFYILEDGTTLNADRFTGEGYLSPIKWLDWEI